MKPDKDEKKDADAKDGKVLAELTENDPPPPPPPPDPEGGGTIEGGK